MEVFCWQPIAHQAKISISCSRRAQRQFAFDILPMRSSRVLLFCLQASGRLPYSRRGPGESLEFSWPWLIWSVVFMGVLLITAGVAVFLSNDRVATNKTSEVTVFLWTYGTIAVILVLGFYAIAASPALARIINNFAKFEEKISVFDSFGPSKMKLFWLSAFCVAVAFTFCTGPLNYDKLTRESIEEKLWTEACLGILWTAGGLSNLMMMTAFVAALKRMQTYAAEVLSTILATPEGGAPKVNNYIASPGADEVIHSSNQYALPRFCVALCKHCRCEGTVTSSSRCSPSPSLPRVATSLLTSKSKSDEILEVERHLLDLDNLVDEILSYFGFPLLIVMTIISVIITLLLYFAIDTYLTTHEFNWMLMQGACLILVAFIYINNAADQYNKQVQVSVLSYH